MAVPRLTIKLPKELYWGCCMGQTSRHVSLQTAKQPHRMDIMTGGARIKPAIVEMFRPSSV